MQPIDQTSTDVPYSLYFMRSSGARYHKVTTFRVIGFKGYSCLDLKFTYFSRQAKICDFHNSISVQK